MQGENEGFTENNLSKEFTEFNQTEGFTVYKEIFDPTRPPSIKGEQLYNPQECEKKPSSIWSFKIYTWMIHKGTI